MEPFLAVLLAVLPAPHREAPGWVGAWRSEGSPERWIHLEPERATLLAGGALSFYRVRDVEAPAPGGPGPGERGDLVLETGGRLTPLALEVGEDGRLGIRAEPGPSRHGGDPWSGTWVRLERVPETLALPTVPMASPEPVDPDVRAELVAELARRSAEDQRVRRSRGPSSPEELREMRAVDEDNVEFLLSILAELGWIDAERFGTEANQDAFLIVQHSLHLGLMHATLPLIEAEARAGTTDPQLYALLFDRYRLHIGYRQRFGTQLAAVDSGTALGEVVLQALEAPEDVEARRAELGIFPLAEYLEHFREQNGGRPIRHLDEVLAARGRR